MQILKIQSNHSAINFTFIINMIYENALNILINKQSLGIMPGLERVQSLLNIMGNPQNNLQIIHIAGTNGKGTVSSTIADCLINQGFKVGLFTSPWVIDYREQIQINNSFIEQDALADYVEKYSDCDATEFEMLTAIMYKYFSDEKVDYAVVECGMGGLEDSTNAIDKSLLSVITKISVDHTNFLGNSISEIAEHKAGIIKSGGKTVFYPDEEYADIIRKKCSEKNAELFEIADKGNAKDNNYELIKTALSVLGFDCEINIIQLPARQEKIGKILLDGGHNLSAAAFLSSKLNDEIAVIGMMADKDVDGYLSIIAPKCKKIIAVKPDNPRALDAVKLAELAGKYCDDVVAMEDSAKAVMQPGVSLVCGSFFLARDVRKILLNMLI